MVASFGVLSLFCTALVLTVISVAFQQRPESIVLVEQRMYRTTILSEDDGFNGDINRQAKKLIQRAAQEKAHAAQEKKKGADLVTKAERTCEIAEVMKN